MKIAMLYVRNKPDLTAEYAEERREDKRCATLRPLRLILRPAATLVEVLIAIFCVSVGMISVLVLFPAGLQNMAEAVRENRLAQAAANAEAVADWSAVRTDARVQFASRAFESPVVFADPIGWDNGLRQTTTNSTLLAASQMEEGIPLGRITVGIDEINLGGQTIELGATVTFQGLPRSDLASMSGAAAVRMLAGEDDIAFNVNGEPLDALGTGSAPSLSVVRERRYSAAFLWRRSDDPRVADLSLVLYSGRKLRMGGGTDALTNEFTYRGPSAGISNVFMKGQTTATVAWPEGTTPPPIKRGQWVLDATVGQLTLPPGVNAQQTQTFANGYFYKIEGVGDVKSEASSQNSEYRQTIILDRPARADGFVAVFVPDVVAVIEKSNGKMPR